MIYSLKIFISVQIFPRATVYNIVIFSECMIKKSYKRFIWSISEMNERLF